MDVVRATEQLTMLIRVPFLPQYKPWLFSAVYASPTLSKCTHLWSHLISVASEYHMPWLVMGDLMNY